MDTSKYFCRTCIFSQKGGAVRLIDINKPDAEIKELESWFGVIFQLADGQHRVAELVGHFSRKYPGGPPPSLEKTVHSVIERMVEAKLVALCDEATTLPYYLSVPYEQLDLPKAKALIRQDMFNGSLGVEDVSEDAAS